MMTTIHVLSDVHLEFQPYKPPVQVQDVDIVALAGDIDVGTGGLRWARYYFPNSKIIYISGNHEFYRQNYNDLLLQFRREAEHYKIHFLENDEVILNGIRFLGFSLWTDYMCSENLSHEQAMEQINYQLADHRLITLTENDKQRLFLTRDAWKIHKTSTSWLTKKLYDESFTGKTVVVSHHGPSKLCENPFFGHTNLSGAFYSNLTNLVEQTDLWIFGHTHANLDIQINERTRLLSNQRGYPSENCDGFDKNLLIKL